MLEDDQFTDYGVRHLLMPVQLKSAWTDKQARSLAEDSEPMDSHARKVAPRSEGPLPLEGAPVSGACKHLRKLIANHMLTCRDCKCVVETLSALVPQAQRRGYTAHHAQSTT